MTYLCIVSTEANRVAKFKAFADEASANSHQTSYGGQVYNNAAGTPVEHLHVAGAVVTVVQPPATAQDVNMERDRRILAGFSIDFGGGVIKQFDADAAAQKRISAVHSLALGAIVGGAQPNDLRWANPDVDFAWICADNTSVPMDADTAREFAEAAMGYESALVTTARIMKDSGAIPGDYANDQYWPSRTLTLG